MKKTWCLMAITLLLLAACPNDDITGGTISGDRIINHTNYDPAGFTDAEIAKARTLKVYFEHASTGQDIFGDSNNNSTTGTKDSNKGNCGLALLAETTGGARYTIPRNSITSTNDGSFPSNTWTTYNGSWFVSGAGKSGGLQTNKRGNPASQLKASGFGNLEATTHEHIDVAMFKFCWVDCWDSGWENSAPTTQANPSVFATQVINQIVRLQSTNPNLVIVYWTMPLQKDSDDVKNAYRDAYNASIRNYCRNNNKWLLDMADIECHNDAGVKRTSAGSKELAYEEYCSDTGHLSDVGALKMAKAYWSLLAKIAATKP